jgi:hypothetical protein
MKYPRSFTLILIAVCFVESAFGEQVLITNSNERTASQHAGYSRSSFNSLDSAKNWIPIGQNQWALNWREAFKYNNNDTISSQLNEQGLNSTQPNTTYDGYTYDIQNNLIADTTYTYINDVLSTVYLITNTYNAQNKVTNILQQMLSNGVWVNETQTLNTYDTINYLTDGLTQAWISTTWNNSSEIWYRYDGNHNITSHFGSESAWSNDWQVYSLDSFTYDSHNNKITEVYGTYDYPGLLVAGEQYFYTYDTAYNLTGLTENTYNQSGYNWLLYQKDNYTYDAHHNKVFLEETSVGSTGMSYTALIEKYGYDSFNNLIADTSDIYGTNGVGVTEDCETFTYNSNNSVLTDYKKYIVTENWWPISNESYVYDNNNNLLSDLMQTASNGVLYNSTQTSFTYDGDNNKISALYQSWNNTDYDWISSDSTHWYYLNSTTGILNLEPNTLNILVYPNPTSDFLTIKTTDSDSGIKIKVLDGLGRTMISISSSRSQAIINMKYLATGSYLVEIETEYGKAVKKIIKE